MGEYNTQTMIRKKTRDEKPVIDLTGPDGNAHVLLGYARQWAKQLDLDFAPIRKDMTSGDYEHLLSVLEKYFGDYIILER